MRFRDLGSLVGEVQGERRTFGSTRQASLLSLLVMRANQRVSVDELVEAAWGSGASVSSASVDNQLWRLRKVLEPDRRARQGSSSLVNEAGGFRLRVDVDDVDSLVFQRLVSASLEALDAGRPGDALRLADDALRLWRGRPYEAIADLPAASAVVARLEELRDQLLQRRVDAMLAIGDVDSALAGSSDLVRQMPFRERVWAQRMQALSLAGRTEEALATYQQARSTLVDEVGLEPGQNLQDLHQQILQGDRVKVDRAVRVASPAATSVEAERLPARTTRLIGRYEDLHRVQAMTLGKSLVTITGPGGGGKTRLALEVGHGLEASFPAGVFFIDLNAVTDPASVVEAITSAVGLEAITQHTALATLSAYTRDRRMLLIVDNCEHVLEAAAEVVAAIVGQERPVAVLATSREPLGLAGEQIWPLPPLSLVGEVDPATGDRAPSAAVELFLERVRSTAPRLELDQVQLRVVDEVCAALDGLPLAIELAAARSRSFTLAEIAEQVATDPSRLARLGRGPADHRRTVHDTIEWSHRLLPPAEQVLHRRLSVLPGRFTRAAAHAVAAGVAGGRTLVDAEVDDLLAMLVHRSLVTVATASSSTGPTSYIQLATVRAHAAQCLSEADEGAQALGARATWVRDLLAGRPPLGRPEEVAWNDRIEIDYPTVRAVIGEASDPETLRLGAGLLHFWYYRSRMVEGARWLEGSVAAAPGASSEATILRVALVAALFLCGRVEAARAVVADLPAPLEVGQPARRELGEALSGAVKAAWSRNQFDVARMLHAQMRGVAENVGDADLELVTDAVGTAMHLLDPDMGTTAARAAAVYDRALEDGNLEAQWVTAGVGSIVALFTSDPVAGISWSDHMMRAHLPLGTGGMGVNLEGLANFMSMSPDAHGALRMYAAAQAQTERVGMVWPSQQLTLELVEQTRSRLTESDAALAWKQGWQLTLEDVARERGLL